MNYLNFLSDSLGIIIEYLNIYEIINLYLSYYKIINIFKYIQTINYFPSSSFPSLSFSSLISLKEIKSFLKKCFNIKYIYLNYSNNSSYLTNNNNNIDNFEFQLEVSKIILNELPYNNKIKSIQIMIPEYFSIEFIQLYDQYIQNISKISNENLNLLFIDIPGYKSDMQSISFQIHQNCPNIREIHGIEFNDHLFYELSLQTHEISNDNDNDNNKMFGFLDVDCWPHLEILHIGNLINRYYSLVDNLSYDNSTISQLESIFISKFTKSRFPSVTILDFNLIDSTNLTNFFTILTKYFLINPNEKTLHIWNSISIVRLNQSFNESLNQFEIQENWKLEFKALQQFKIQQQNYSSYENNYYNYDNNMSNSNQISNYNIILLFPSISFLQFYSITPSIQFISYFQLFSDSKKLQFSAFFEDITLQNYLQLFLVQKQYITKLSLYERICDYQDIMNHTNLYKTNQNIMNKRNKFYTVSFLDYLFENYTINIFFDYFIKQNNSIKKSLKLSYDGVLKFLEVENDTLTLLHLNESFLTKNFNEYDNLLFINCYQLQTIIIELDLMCRIKDRQTQYLTNLQNFILYFQRNIHHYKNNELKYFQFNVWTIEQFELLSHELQLILLSIDSSEHISNYKMIEVKLHLRSYHKKTITLGYISE